jgi:predicted nuclease of restriction endonuclease-like RecB superfamily
MVLRLQYIKYQIKGTHLLPYFLTTSRDQALPQRLINYFESHVGKIRDTIDFEEPLTWAPDNRVVRALISTLLNRFYSFLSHQIEDHLDQKQLIALKRQGIASLEDFRLWFWKYVQDHHGGFFPPENRKKIFNDVSEHLELPPTAIESLLTAHREDQMLLQRNNSPPSAEQLISAYNYEVLETFLYHSDSVNLNVSGTSLGATARSLLKYTKRYGVLVELESLNSNIRATIAGPQVFFGRASSFGWNIAQVISHLLQEAPSLKIRVEKISIDVILRDRHYIVQLDSKSMPMLLPRGQFREDMSFLDSKVEKQFYWSWHNNKFRGWDIIREPEVFIFGSCLIIPDFALVKGKHRVLLEIIGYWREEYTQKKRAQLELLKLQGLKHMILLVDTKHRKYFTKSIYPVIFYRLRGKRYEIPYGKILKALPG